MADRQLVGGRRLGKLLPIRPAAVSEVANLFLMHRAIGITQRTARLSVRMDGDDAYNELTRSMSSTRSFTSTHAINADVEKDRWSVEAAAQSAIE